MDLIYIILSVFLRLSPAVRKLSTVTSGSKNRRCDLVGLAFWIPLVGWVSVSVQHMPWAKWLTWRVREVTAFHFTSLNSQQKQSWKVDPNKRGRDLPPCPQSPDAPGDSPRNTH